MAAGNRPPFQDIVCAIRNGGTSDNHSIAYCLLGYLCGYYRHYYPMEFITAYLNNAQNDEDILNGTNLMKLYGIRIMNPKWGISRGGYFFDKENKIIYKGLGSVKYIGESVSDELYRLAKEKHYSRFSDLLADINRETSIDSRQINILIQIDFFSDFGNQRELFRIVDLFEMFKKGGAKQLKKSAVDGTPLEEIVKRYSVGTTKSGADAKSYTLLDVGSILRESEDAIKAVGMEDISDIIKVRNFADVMGYAGYISGKEEDRAKLYITGIKPVRRKSDGKQFGYSVFTQSIGNGRESRFTVKNRVFNKMPIKEKDLIRCKLWKRNGAYFEMLDYDLIVE